MCTIYIHYPYNNRKHPLTQWCVYTVLIHCSYTLTIYTSLIHCPYKLSIYTILIHCPYALFMCTILIHYPYTLSLYTIHIHYPYTLSIYTIHIHYPYTLSLYNIHIHICIYFLIIKGMLSACCNPILYGLLNENFKSEFKTIFKSFCQKV